MGCRTSYEAGLCGNRIPEAKENHLQILGNSVLELWELTVMIMTKNQPVQRWCSFKCKPSKASFYASPSTQLVGWPVCRQVQLNAGSALLKAADHRQRCTRNPAKVAEGLPKQVFKTKYAFLQHEKKSQIPFLLLHNKRKSAHTALPVQGVLVGFLPSSWSLSLSQKHRHLL